MSTGPGPHKHTVKVGSKTYTTAIESPSHTHVETQVIPPETDPTVQAKVDAAIAAHLAAYHVPPDPPVTTPSSPITVTTDNVTIADKSFTGPFTGPGGIGAQGFGIHAAGTPAAPVRNLIIRRCSFKGWNVGINLEFTYTFTIEDCIIEDVLYAGILTFTATDGTIQRNTIRRIGYQAPPPIDVNAYAIALSRGGGDDLTAQPRSERITVDSNIIEDVPTWHGLDTHGGKDIIWSNNTIRRCMRPVFLTGGAVIHPVNQTFTGNRIEEAKSYPFGGSPGGNLAAITLVGLQGGDITNTVVSSTYPTPYVYDYTGTGQTSTGVTVSGTTVIP